MKTWQIILIALTAAAVLIALGGFLIVRHGDAKYDEGRAACATSQAQAQTQQTSKAVQTRDRIENETRNMSDVEIDDDLRDLGIMRNATDR